MKAPEYIRRAGVCRSCLGRQKAAIEAMYWERMPEDPPGACPDCGLPRYWTIAPDGVGVAVCVSCLLALLWDQSQQLMGLRKIVQAMTAPAAVAPKRNTMLVLAGDRRGRK